ncbi:MAG: hypothetical protein LDL53_13050 [Candidatus Hydrogenedens sp.]|nr:hypothetical protein [Candidatus Hydrogenedens sp.]
MAGRTHGFAIQIHRFFYCIYPNITGASFVTHILSVTFAKSTHFYKRGR